MKAEGRMPCATLNLRTHVPEAALEPTTAEIFYPGNITIL